MKTMAWRLHSPSPEEPSKEKGMKVENRPDGWHILRANGESVGPIKSLHELEDLLDKFENLDRASAEQEARQARESLGGASNPLPKFSS
jgi:hypothetical protein